MKQRRTIVPTERLFSNAKFHRLGCHGQHLLLRMYAGSCRWGRGPASAQGVVAQLSLLPDFGADIEVLLELLHRLSFIQIYDVDGQQYYQINHYDQDQLADMLRKRGASPFPARPSSPSEGGQG